MVRFTGRSVETTTIPTKPIPTGYKVWVVAESGYFLRWLWHTHGKGPVGLTVRPQPRPRPRSSARTTKQATEIASVEEPYLNPTQNVVLTLLKQLPPASYHVFLDNLFSSPDLFRVLRQHNIGATGTCRPNSGIDETFAARKKQLDKGKDFPWGHFTAIPTSDAKVSYKTYTHIFLYTNTSMNR
jgi:hypothetical protein